MIQCDSCDEWYHGRCVTIKSVLALNINTPAYERLY